MDEVACNGSENGLLNCRFDRHTADCDHTEDAAVKCAPGGNTIINQSQLLHAACAYLSLSQVTVFTAIYDWTEETVCMKDEWKFVLMDTGAQSLMMDGEPTML